MQDKGLRHRRRSQGGPHAGQQDAPPMTHGCVCCYCGLEGGGESLCEINRKQIRDLCRETTSSPHSPLGGQGNVACGVTQGAKRRSTCHHQKSHYFGDTPNSRMSPALEAPSTSQRPVPSSPIHRTRPCRPSFPRRLTKQEPRAPRGSENCRRGPRKKVDKPCYCSSRRPPVSDAVPRPKP